MDKTLRAAYLSLSKLKEKLESDIFETRNNLEALQEKMKWVDGALLDNKLKRIEIISKEHPPGEQKCTCDLVENPVKAGPNGDIIKCYKHLSRHYENQGCFYCNFTDCSKWDC